MRFDHAGVLEQPEPLLQRKVRRRDRGQPGHRRAAICDHPFPPLLGLAAKTTQARLGFAHAD